MMCDFLSGHHHHHLQKKMIYLNKNNSHRKEGDNKIAKRIINKRLILIK